MRNGLSSGHVLVPLLLVSAGALILGASVGASTHRQSAASIEGTWDYGTGQVLVTATGGDGYVGTVTKTATFSAGCPHAVGEKVWHMRGGGQHYEGTHEGYGTSCDQRITYPADWEVTETSGKFAVEECVTITIDNNRQDCQTLDRLKPPASSVVTRTVPLYRAYVYFPKSAYDTTFTRSYARAGGTVSVSRSAGGMPCLVKVRGLQSRARYSVHLDTTGATRGAVNTSGPWRQLGTFRALTTGAGTFRCTTAPPVGSVIAVNATQPKSATILISATLR